MTQSDAVIESQELEDDDYARRCHEEATTEARLFRESEERAAFESWLDQLDRGRTAELDLSVAPF